MSEHPNPSAFPSPDERDADGCGIREGSCGMTLRDWFAGQALTGGMANADGYNFSTASDCATMAFLIADAMLAERSKP